MSHPRLQSHRNTYRARADGIRAQLAQAERAQLANRELPARLRQRNVRHLRQQAQARLDGLRQEYLAGTTGVLKAMWAPLFRLPPRVLADMSWRDAMRQAEAIDSQDDALRLLETSLMVGDDLLVKALAFHACPNPIEHPPRWPAVAARWQQSDPAVREAIQAFDECWQELNDQQVKFQDSTMFHLPGEQPTEAVDALPRLEPVTAGPHEPPAAS